MASLLSAVASAITGGDSSTSSTRSIPTTTTSSTSQTSATSTSDPSITTTSASTSSAETTSAADVTNPNTGSASSSTSLSHASTGTSSSNTASSSSIVSSLSVTDPSSTISSTLKVAITTSVQATVTSTGSNGELFTTVVETQSILSAGSVVTSTSSFNDSTTSPSHTGAIVGGVLGGVGGLLVILAILFVLLQRSRRQRELDEAFDGNFDPDHIVRSGGLGLGSEGGSRESGANNISGYAYAGGEKAKMKKQAMRASYALECTPPDIPLNEGPSPEMQQLMVSTGGFSRNHILDEEGMDDDDGMGGQLNGTSIGGAIVTPYTVYNAPSLLYHSVPSSPAPSSSYHIPSPYHSSFPLLGSASSDGHEAMGPGMISAQSAKEREAFGGRPPSMSMSASASMSGHGHPALAYSTNGYGRPPSMTGGSVYGNPYPGMAGSPPGSPPLSRGVPELPVEGRRYSNSPIDTRRYSTGPVQAINSGLAVMNPDSSDIPVSISGFKPPQGSSMYAASGEVLVHQDGGRLPEEEVESPEEIPPTYVSLNLSG